MSRRVLSFKGDHFEVLAGKHAEPRAVVVFAAGAGGDPDRHLPLLRSLAAQGCTIVAPRFERLASMTPDADELVIRARRLQRAFDEVAQPGIPGVGVGHSIGAMLLLMLAGAEAATRAGQTIRGLSEPRLDRLALMAPATDFFKASGALRGVTASLAVWAGGKDDITPPGTARLLTTALHGVVPIELHVIAGAGHFSFMNDPPPHATKPLTDRTSFLEQLAQDIGSFATR